MATTLKGKVTIESMSGVSITYAALVTNGAVEALSAEASHEAEVEVRRDAAGTRKGYRIKDERWSITIEAYATVSTGTSRADAKKALVPPSVCSKVVLSGFEAAALNGNWIYEQGAKYSFGDQYAKITLPLVKPEDDTADNLCAAVTA